MNKYINKVNNKLSNFLNKKSGVVSNEHKIISFTFDDAPSSAFQCGGDILTKKGVNGTYYVALSFMGDEQDDDKLFTRDTLVRCIEQGNEVGCHTFGHTSAFNVTASEYLSDIELNLKEVRRHNLNAPFKNFSYPFGEITPKVKKKILGLFRSYRGIRHGVNVGDIDLGNLKSVRLYEKTHSLEEIKGVLAEFNKSGGWLIFYTHDVEDNFSEYGCSPSYFENAVKMSLDSGAKIMTINEALDVMKLS
jgi:peptidoglycan/xylan/chitin deacetylase (PgdA/CDA1 family)